MNILLLVLSLLVAAPASAQNALAWPADKRPIAETASNITVAAAIGLDTLHSWRSDHRGLAFRCQAIRVGATMAVSEILKRSIHKQRPDASDFKSFPSMHTGIAMASAVGHRRIGFSLAVGTGIFRMGANRHDIIDVLGGLGIGYLSSNLCAP